MTDAIIDAEGGARPAVDSNPSSAPPASLVSNRSQDQPGTGARAEAAVHFARRVQGGFVGVGVLTALTLGARLVAAPAWASWLLGAAALLSEFALVGWLTARLIRAAAVAFDAWTRRIQSVESVELQVIAALGRLAEALEQRPAAASVPAPVATGVESVAEIRKAIEEDRWEQASALLQEFQQTQPDSPEGGRLAQELESARTEGVRRLQAKLAAAREVGDPDRVLELRDGLQPLLSDDDSRSLDHDLIRWLMGLIQKRLRTGTIRVDVVELAAKAAERFDHTPEGASLRAALPTLRRSAGLCARCGQPYKGLADACPDCLGHHQVAAVPGFDAGPAYDDDEDEFEAKVERDPFSDELV